ncbi:unnamed protein product [Parajaminaea phylloscopi]
MAAPRDTGVAPQDFKEFDIVVVGGGTAGLALASRIATSSQLQVGVLEAGQWRPDDEKINYPAYIGQALMNPDYDWCYETVEQKHCKGRRCIHPRGKVLGGSSALNFLVWQRGHSAEFDAWEALGNSGWSWKDLIPYFKASGTVRAPSTELQTSNFATLQEEVHGSNGPVQVSYSAWYSEPQKHFLGALKDLGLNKNVDGLRGENSGVWVSPSTVCQKTWTRSYSASAHFSPNQGRDNLKVLCGAQASQIVLDGDRATGVRFLHNGKEYTVKARREVVVSSGSINSPQLLELSGIGSPRALEAAGVEVKVPLEGVGHNLQEHLYCGSSYEIKDGSQTWDRLRNSTDFAAEALRQYQSQDVDRGIIASAFSGFAFLPLSKFMSEAEVAKVKEEVQGLVGNESSYYANELERDTVCHYLKQLDDPSVPAMEYIFAPGFFASASAPKEGKDYFSILSALQHPFARGTTHITSKDPLAKPAFDPRYFSVRSDLTILAKAVKWCDEIAKSASLKEYIVARQDPLPGKYESQAEIEDWVQDNVNTEYHSCGTCSMAPLAKGGVVDERLRVHKVRGLRVADASVIPLMPSSHLVAVVYAIAEKAAAMILEDLGGVAV